MKFLLEISARLSNIATMVPNGGADDENTPHFFKLHCQNCQELSKRQCVYISESCKKCKKYGTVTLTPGYGRPFTAEDSESGAYAPLMLFDCDEMAPEGYGFNGGWKLTTVISTSNFIIFAPHY
uniref:UPF0587 protein GA18326-like n=1 Tax=Nicotiana tabacum TaxID=4097 RepID=A0A1S3ZXB6_TOBAC|nr:PREDICTED: UPF0587 protein GA18326-like [Nicotiana tabacum]